MAKRGGAREGSGRKKMEGVVYTSIRIDAEAWAKMPSPKAAYVRQAVKEKLEREENEIFWRNYTMTKIELLRQYIGDLKMHVPESQGRNNRIAVLEEELEHEQLQNTSPKSEYAKPCECGSRAVIMICEKCNKSTEIMDYHDFA